MMTRPSSQVRTPFFLTNALLIALSSVEGENSESETDDDQEALVMASSVSPTYVIDLIP